VALTPASSLVLGGWPCDEKVREGGREGGLIPTRTSPHELCMLSDDVLRRRRRQEEEEEVSWRIP
jgi:hypothetical protein